MTRRKRSLDAPFRVLLVDQQIHPSRCVTCSHDTTNSPQENDVVSEKSGRTYIHREFIRRKHMMMINDLPLDIFRVITSYSTKNCFKNLLNTSKQCFQQIKKKLIVLNLNETKSLEYLTDVSFRERVLSVVENGWKQVNLHVEESHWYDSTPSSNPLIDTRFVRPKKAQRCPSPYIIFCSEKRPELKAAFPKATSGEMYRMFGQMWSRMDKKAKMVSNPNGDGVALQILGLCSQSLF